MDRRIVVVTGARKGIGRYVVEQMLKEGYFVHGCSRSESDLNHANYQHHLADVSDDGQIKKMVSNIRKTHRTVDVLINNAGIASMNHSMLTPLEVVNSIVRTNFVGTFNCTIQFARLLRGSKYGGRIVNFSTVAVPLHLEGEAAYAASKSGVEELTRILAKELGPYGIFCNAIGPTPVETDLLRNVGKKRLQKLIEQQVIKRCATPDDIWKTIRFLIDPDIVMITGQIIYLGGVF